MLPFALIGPLGWSELLIIFFIILIIFGPRKLPEVAEAMGKSIQKFKKASKDARREIETGLDNNDEEESKKE
ncbi:MAG: twin-arginine translocase TatA/TatE family subunit [Candidatus Latescibacterota bacterium]|jgi:sec-independent protein translocase protein TatA